MTVLTKVQIVNLAQDNFRARPHADIVRQVHPMDSAHSSSTNSPRARNSSNLDQVILREVAEKGRKRGVEVARTEMVNALTALVEEGLAKAYMLSCTQPFSVELETMPVLDVIEEYYSMYFLATQRGIELHVAYDASERLDADEGNRQSEG
jgi:hypothetical protein